MSKKFSFDDFMDAVFDESVRDFLKPEFLLIIDQNLKMWKKIFAVGFMIGQEKTQYAELWESHREINWLLPALAYWFECSDNNEEEAFFEKQGRLTLQVFALGIWAAIVTVHNIDATPILFPDLAIDGVLDN